MRMPKDYFEVEEVQEHVSEEDKQSKGIKSANACFIEVNCGWQVIEFVYQVTRKTCPPGDFTAWLQDGK